MARLNAKNLRNVMRMKAVGLGHMQQSETGGYVRLEDYDRAVSKAVEEQRAVMASSVIVRKLARLCEAWGDDLVRDEARSILGKAGDV